jgi:hypothetical protein
VDIVGVLPGMCVDVKVIKQDHHFVHVSSITKPHFPLCSCHVNQVNHNQPSLIITVVAFMNVSEQQMRRLDGHAIVIIVPLFSVSPFDP